VDILSFVATSGVFLIMGLVTMLGVVILCKVRCDK